MKRFAFALLLAVFVLPGLASAQYYVDMTLTSDVNVVHDGDTICFTVCFDHNVDFHPNLTLQGYYTTPWGYQAMIYEENFVLPAGDHCCTWCYEIPGCGYYGDYIASVHLFWQGTEYASDEIIVTYEQ